MTISNLNDDQKIQILLAQVQERYSSAHKMRERSMQFTLWLSGMAIGLAWLLINQKTLTFFQCLALTLLITALCTVAGIFILGLRKGFQNNRNAMIKCEQALGMYEAGKYLQDDSLLPVIYEQTKGKWNDHFSTLCVWLCVVALSLLVLMWACHNQPGSGNKVSSDKKIEQIKGKHTNGRSKQ